MAETYSAGIVTAYGAAVRGGYTGTYEQWCQDMANLGDNVAEVRTKAAQAAQSAENAAGSATAAAESAGSAAGSASEAASSAGNAAGSATAAAESATAAAGSATNAASSATAASASATAAGNAQTAAETAQGKAEDAQEAAEDAQEAAEAAAQSVSQSAAQIATNTQDISDLQSSKAPVIIDAASGSIASFPDGADGMPIKELTVNIEPVQSGTGDPAPDNVRPISGWTGANVTRTGKNLGELTDGTKLNSQQCTVTYIQGGVSVISTGNYGRSGYVIQVKKGQQYTCSFKARRVGDIYGIFLGNAAEWNYQYKVFTASDIGAASTQLQFIFTATTDVFFFGIYPLYNGSELHVQDFQLKPGSTASAYEPYQGNTYPISFPSEAGTVYGGTLTINDDGTGELMATYAKDTFVGDDQWAQYTYGFTRPIPAMKTGFRQLGLSNWLYYDGNPMGQHSYWLGFNNKFLYVINVSDLLPENTLDEWKTYLNSHPLEFYYPLANPITYQLTQQQVIDTLLGTNNIWADCGDVETEYRADTKLYIQKINAPADDDMTADAQIAGGKYFIVGNNLYLSTTVIPAGDTIIPGTNCQQTNLAEALNALNV